MNSKKPSKPQHRNSPTAAKQAHGHPGTPVTFTLHPTLSRRRGSGDYQKKMRSMSTTTERTESRTCDAEPTTAILFASTMDKTAAPASRTFQPFGSGTDDKNLWQRSKKLKRDQIDVSN